METWGFCQYRWISSRCRLETCESSGCHILPHIQVWEVKGHIMVILIKDYYPFFLIKQDNIWRKQGGTEEAVGKNIYLISTSNLVKEISSAKTMISQAPSVNESFSDSYHLLMNHSDIFHLQGISQNSSMNQRLPIASKCSNSSQETEAPSQGSSSASNMTSLQHKCPQTMTTPPWNSPFTGNLLIFTERPFATSQCFLMKPIQCGTSRLAQSSP